MKIDNNLIKANNLFLNTGNVSDKDLDILIEFYFNLTDSLKIMGEKFHFAWREANDNLNRLEEYKRARKK